MGHLDDVTPNFRGTCHIAAQGRSRFRLIRGDQLGDRLSALGDHNRLAAASQPPLSLLANGTQDGLMLVRRYLDAWRGGLFAAPNAADRNFAPYSDDDIVIV